MKRQFSFFVFIFLGITGFAQTDWVNIQPGGKNFNFQNPQVMIPAGYNDVLIGYGLQYLIPDRENYDPNLTYNYLDNLDAHRISVIRIFMENPMRVTYSSTGDPYYFNPFWMEDRPGSFEDSSHWSLDENPGFFRIITQVGDTWMRGSSAKNLLLRAVDPPEMDNFSVITKVTFVPQGNYDCASLFLYQDKDNYVRLSRHPSGIEFCRDQFEEGRLAFKFNKQTNMFEDEYYDRTDEMEAFDAQLEGYGIMQLRNLGLDKYHRLKSKKSKLQWLKLHGYKHLKDAAINVPVSPPANVWHN